MSDKSIIQTVAQAMLDSDIDQGHADINSPWGRYEVLAGAAIGAMREPTSYMIAAAAGKPGQQTYGDVWRTMIDEVLK